MMRWLGLVFVAAVVACGDGRVGPGDPIAGPDDIARRGGIEELPSPKSSEPTGAKDELPRVSSEVSLDRLIREACDEICALADACGFFDCRQLCLGGVLFVPSRECVPVGRDFFVCSLRNCSGSSDRTCIQRDPDLLPRCIRGL